jgi:DNA-binding Lrp family transcriptional regulator
MISRFSEIDLDVLALAEINFDSVETMSRIIKRKPHQVQYSIRKLKMLGVLQQLRAWIDVHALGFHFVTVCLRFAPTRKAVRHEFISFVSKHPSTTWVFETTGDFHLAVSLAVREIPEVFTFFEILEKYSKIIITTKVLNIQRDFEFLGRRYLRSAKCKISPIELPSSKVPYYKVDEIDRVILATLSQGDWITERDLSTRIGVPYTTINRRLLSLRQKKILRGYSYWLETEHFDRQSVILRIKVSGIAAWVKEKIWKFARAHRSVVYIVECIGSWEYEIGADIKSAAEMLRLVDEILSLLEGVEVSVEPVMVTSFHKTQSFPGAPPPSI